MRSAWLPRVAKSEKPSRRSRAQSRMAVASAPECETNAMPPASGIPGANEALSRRAGRIQPRQLGPSTRMGWLASHVRSSASRACPSGPASRNPAEITTAPPTPLATHSLSAGSTAGAGTAITARSTGPSIASRDAAAGSPWTTSAARVHGQDAALEARGAQVGDDAAADLGGISGGPDDGHALRLEERGEVSAILPPVVGSSPMEAAPPGHHTRKPGVVSGVVATRRAREGPYAMRISTAASGEPRAPAVEDRRRVVRARERLGEARHLGRRARATTPACPRC